MISAALFAAAVAVGFLIGAVGIGGILLIPGLIALGNLTPHQASATALFTFIFTGILGTVLFQRRGSIDWRQSLVVCASAIVFSYLGAMAGSMVGDATLLWVIAVLIVFAGIYVLLPVKPRPTGAERGLRLKTLIAIGAASGFGSGFSGAGGPLFSVPLMVIFGFAPLSTIGTSQVLQVFSATAGTLANLQVGDIQWTLAGWIAGGELVGVVAGAKLAHAVSPAALKRGAGVVCLLVGSWLLIHNL
jgi:uncharacterized membrane protein YfcA